MAMTKESKQMDRRTFHTWKAKNRKLLENRNRFSRVDSLLTMKEFCSVHCKR
jgi:hypothetical protein